MKISIVKQNGFSLVEVMFTLTIAVIVIGIGAPSFNDFIQQTRLILATNSLHSAINLTRSEAIKRNGRVDLVSINGNWKNGWEIKSANTIISTHEALHPTISISSGFFDNSTQYIAYNGTGRTRTNVSSKQPQAGTISIKVNKSVRRIKIDFLGRARVCNPAEEKLTCTTGPNEK
ncbi:GspH/FimT family pseudopilin [Solimicrobium silvestre]|uniref:Type II secretion system protein H n=1 Tax=Solimicrobium silvestre TaxID=2099400 RepID=A0A2S9H4Z0_9BURK|nr:GspH/FimT family pseudopilin [Solimicrobium silvestre]PRC95055.1 Prepilin-type N-terminal cleavage/methylation domain [Solimicrobium silvestre]